MPKSRVNSWLQLNSTGFRFVYGSKEIVTENSAKIVERFLLYSLYSLYV